MKNYRYLLILSMISAMTLAACEDESGSTTEQNCLEDDCTKTCDKACTPGEWSCTATGYMICEASSDTECPSWGESKSCPENTVCDAQKMECADKTSENTGDVEPPDDSCESECSEGEMLCNHDNTAIVTCKRKSAGECNTLVAVKACAEDEVCEISGNEASCISTVPQNCTPGEKKCSEDGKGIMKCVANDSGNAWKTEACPEEQICSDASCQTECGEPCTNGAKQCSDKGLPQVCKQLESGCLTWVDEAACPEAQHCDQGACIANCTKDCDPWSIVILPDTQNYPRNKPKDSVNTPYHDQLNWIVEQKKNNSKLIPNLKMVVHMGDITDNNSDEHWSIAKSAHDILKKNNIPFTVVNGNHDYRNPYNKDTNPSGGLGSRAKTKFPTYFPKSYLETLPGFGGIYANTNTYFNFNAGGQDYLVLNLEFAPRQQTLCWANKLLQQKVNLNKKVIITTHANISNNAAYSGKPQFQYVPSGASGQELWDGLTSRHSNIIMVLNGHVGDSERKEVKGHNKNVVEQILTDYQFEVPCTEATLDECKTHCNHVENAGNGWLRILTFDPKTNKVKVTSTSIYSGSKAHFSKEGKDQFFCSELYHGTDKSYGNWYPADPNNKAHNYEFSFDFTTPQSDIENDGGHLGFVHRELNQVSTGQQTNSSVVAAADGHFVVVWEDDSSDDDKFQKDGKTNAHDVFVRIMDPYGCDPDGLKQFSVDITNGHQAEPDVAMDKDGNFVVVWTDDSDNNGITQVFMQGFDAKGVSRFAPKVVNIVDTGNQYQPHIAMAADGKFAVSWTDERLGKHAQTQKIMPEIWVRGFNSDGSEAFSERAISELPTTNALSGTQVHSDIFMDDSHNIIVVWEDDKDGNTYTETLMRMLDEKGDYKAAAKVVNSNSSGNQNEPSISGTPDGSRFIVSWTNVTFKDEKPNTKYIMAALFNGDGKKIGYDFPVSVNSSNDNSSKVCMTTSGNPVIAWYNATTRNVLYRKSSENTLSDAILGNSPDNTTTKYDGKKTPDYLVNGTSNQPAIACIPNSNYAVLTYSDDADNNGYYEVYGVGLKVQ